ncbi:MAG: hypothetical protein KTR31_21000 [Myxococcales bacterium]|nr:hypothetical protein [Myxococcales bacterium]
MSGLLVLWGLACSSAPSTKADLDVLCDEARTVKTQIISGEGAYATVSPEVRAALFTRQMEARLGSSPIRMAWDVAAPAPGEQRYVLIQAMAKKEGVPDWDCPALQEVLGSFP